MGSCFRLNWRWPDGSITFLWSDNKLFLWEISPICYSFVSASFPFFLSKNSKLLNHFFRLQLLLFSIVCRLLQLYNMILLFLQILKNIQTNFLILVLECRLRQRILSRFYSLFILLISLKLGSLFCFSHNT